jgi:hypothetical protein
MKSILCAIALAGLACAASAQPANSSGSGKTVAAQDTLVASLQSHPAGARSFNDLLAADAGTSTSRTDSRIASGTSSVPEPQTYALLLAGLGAIIFVAVRRRRP